MLFIPKTPIIPISVPTSVYSSGEGWWIQPREGRNSCQGLVGILPNIIFPAVTSSLPVQFHPDPTSCLPFSLPHFAPWPPQGVIQGLVNPPNPRRMIWCSGFHGTLDAHPAPRSFLSWMSVLFSRNETPAFQVKFQEHLNKNVFALGFNKDIPKIPWSGAPNPCAPHSGGW